MNSDEIDLGPNRKVRVRKRSSSEHDVNSMCSSRPRLASSLPDTPPKIYHSSSKKVTPTKVFAGSQQTWFANSFCATKQNKEFQNFQKNFMEKPQFGLADESDILETSDSILASLDMSLITSQHNKKSESDEYDMPFKSANQEKTPDQLEDKEDLSLKPTLSKNSSSPISWSKKLHEKKQTLYQSTESKINSTNQNVSFSQCEPVTTINDDEEETLKCEADEYDMPLVNSANQEKTPDQLEDKGLYLKPTLSKNSSSILWSKKFHEEKLTLPQTSEKRICSTNQNASCSQCEPVTTINDDEEETILSKMKTSPMMVDSKMDALDQSKNKPQNKSPVLFPILEKKEKPCVGIEPEHFSDADIFSSAFSPLGENVSTPNVSNRSFYWKKRNQESRIDFNGNEKSDMNGSKIMIGCDEIKKTLCANENPSLDKQKISTKEAPSSSSLASSSSLLKNRIRHCLFKNAQEKSPLPSVVQLQKLQQEKVEMAKENMKTFQKEKEAGQTNFDLGPFYGLPSKVKQLFESQRGIKELYDWQKECLTLPALISGGNLIYSLPTSGGKTLVAEILILKELLCKKKNALLILPYISIVQEKVKSLSEIAVELDFLVEEYAGSKGRYPPTKRRERSSLYVATIEKAHSLLNQFIELDRMNTLGLVVVDELHMLGEGGSRGAILEATLMKILSSQCKCQIIGMSATLNNMNDLKSFLNAELYTNNFRPVKLTENIKIGENIYLIDQNLSENPLQHKRCTNFQYKPAMTKIDPDHLFGLVLEVIPKNSCLLFCPTKKNCENVSRMLCKLMSKYKRELLELHKQKKEILLQELKSDNNGKICSILEFTIPFGIAYHHSGLLVDERRLIEDAYSSGILSLLTCTSTLAAGVNLPAKRVILRAPKVGNSFISKCQYKQMVGRAGRAGIDSSGESILISQTQDLSKINNLISSPVEKCYSSLMYNNGKGVRFLILSVIGLQLASNLCELFQFLQKSLLHIQSDILLYDTNQVIRDELQTLVDLGLVVQKKRSTVNDSDPVEKEDNSDWTLEITTLGKATYKGSIDIDVSCRLYKDLKAASYNLVLSNHLHLLTLITPYNIPINPCWMTYFNQICSLSPQELSVVTLIGIPEGYMARKAGGQRVNEDSVDSITIERFYLTLMLYEVWNEKSIWEVASKFNQPRGFIQNLITNTCTFASCVLRFTQEINEFWVFEALFQPFLQKLSYNVVADLVPLLEIPGVKKARANQLFNAGYKSLSSIASADLKDLVRTIEHLSKKGARQIIASAKLLLEEKKEALLEEFEKLVSIPGKMAANNLQESKTSIVENDSKNEQQENDFGFSDENDFDEI